MAINPAIKYAGQINPADANYPYGSARDVSSPGAGDGTPLQEDWVNDFLGWTQAILQAAGIVPSGNPETVVSSQLLTALNTIITASISTNVPQATETVAGKAEIATQIETDDGVDDQRFVTPAKLAASRDSLGPWITLTVSSGIPTVVGSSGLSVVRNSNGIYEFTFAVNRPNLKYRITGILGSEGNAERVFCVDDGTKSTSGFTIRVTGTAAGAQNDPSLIDIQIHSYGV